MQYSLPNFFLDGTIFDRFFINKCYHEKIAPGYTLRFCLTKPVEKGVKTRWEGPMDNIPSTYKVREVKQLGVD